MAGLQDICPMESALMVSSRVEHPMRAAAKAASTPAWPAPTTITSYCFGYLYMSFPNHQTEPVLSSRLEKSPKANGSSLIRIINIGPFTRILSLCPSQTIGIKLNHLSNLECEMNQESSGSSHDGDVMVGKEIRMVVPLPVLDKMVILPWCDSMILPTIARPSPDPFNLVEVRTVLKAR